MNIMELKKSLSDKKLQNLYILTGEEYAILDVYIKKICDCCDCDVFTSDSISSIYKTLSGRTLFGTDRRVYVVREDKDFLAHESIWNDIIEKLNKKETILIAKYSSIDARSKFSKAFADNITIFDKLSDSVLHKYISKEIEITNDQALYLINACKSEYGRILLEINKIKNLASYYKLSHTDAFKMCVSANAFYVEPEFEMFDIVDSIMTRNVKLTYDLYEQMKRRGDNELLLLSLLHSNAKAVLQVQTVGSSQDVAKQTGLSPFQVKNAFKYANRYTCEELIRFIRYLRYCDSGVKQGTLSQDMIIDYLLVNIL